MAPTLTSTHAVPYRARFVPWLVAMLAAASGYATGGGTSDWNLTHWLFSYDVEFVRRGLIGTVLWSVFEPAAGLVRVLAAGLLVVSSIALTWFAGWASRGRPPPSGLGLAVLVAACPATLIQFGYDCGRFDQLNLVLFLGALVLIAGGATGASGIVAVLTAVAVLVHEAFFFVHVPVVVALMVYRAGGRLHRVLLLVLVVAVMSTALVARFGAMETMSHEAFQARVLERHEIEERAVFYSSRVLYRELPENIDYAARTLPRRLLQWRSFAIAAVLAPWVWMALVTLRSLHAGLDPARRRGFWFPVGASASPLLLTFVGSDLFRWWSLAVLNLLVVTLVLVRLHPGAAFRIGLGWKSIAMLVGLGLAAGPLGVDSPLPRASSARALMSELVSPAMRQADPRPEEKR